MVSLGMLLLTSEEGQRDKKIEKVLDYTVVAFPLCYTALRPFSRPEMTARLVLLAASALVAVQASPLNRTGVIAEGLHAILDPAMPKLPCKSPHHLMIQINS